MTDHTDTTPNLVAIADTMRVRAPRSAAGLDIIAAILASMGAAARPLDYSDQSDSYCAVWGRAETADGIPFGLIYSLSAASRPRKADVVTVSAEWPEVSPNGSRSTWRPDRLYGDAYRELRAAYDGSVNISGKKAPDAIAREIQRRFMAGYVPLWRVLRARADDELNGAAASERMARDMVAAAGIPASAVRPNGASTSAYFSGRAPGNNGASVTLESFRADDNTVSINAHSVPDDIAAAFLQAIAARSGK